MPVADDSVRVFASVAARDSFLTSPRVGQAVVLLDSGSTLIYYGTTLGWRPPWNLPWGEVAAINVASTHTATTTGTQDWTYFSDLAQPWSPVKDRKYRLSAWFNGGSNADGDIMQFGAGYETSSTPTGANLTVAHKATMTGVSPDPIFVTKETTLDYYTAYGPGGYWILLGISITGSGASLFNGTYFWVDDIGPAANPTIT